MLDLSEIVREEVAKQLSEIKVDNDAELKPIQKSVCIGQTELARHLGITKVTVCKWQREGRLKGCFTRVGRKIIYDLDKLDRKFAG
jgi:DNA-binding transcriptional regulator YiaG